jgi:hypothetical protein
MERKNKMCDSSLYVDRNKEVKIKENKCLFSGFNTISPLLRAVELPWRQLPNRRWQASLHM